MRFHLVPMCVLWIVGYALIPNVDASIFDIFLHFDNKLNTHESYDYARQSIIDIENRMMTGGRIELNRKEMQADEVIRSIKRQEINDGLKDIVNWPPSQHFFQGKEKMEESNIFKILKIMPKGAVLHGHDTAMLSSDVVINNIIPAFPDLLMCRGTDNVLYLIFRRQDWYGCTTYVNVNDEIKRNRSTTQEIMKAINLYTPTPEIDYPNIHAVWYRFNNIFRTVDDFFTHIEVYKTHLWCVLKEFYDDQVMYIEFRSSIKTPYNSTGHVYSKLETMAIIIDVVNEFKKLHPHFIGVKFIYSVNRKDSAANIQKKLDTYNQLRSAYPDWIVGFDLVGQEDLGLKLENFVDLLREYPGPYNFHAGETNFFEAAADTNLVDSLLLGTKRIGHGYSMNKHPFLLDVLKKRDIAIEVCPISNQVLHLVWDLRNHPGASFLSEDIPMVISCDDPGFWNSKAMTPDYYYAFMSFASAGSGLRLLKQLVLNTIKYSYLTSSERVEAVNLFEKQWDFFLDNVIAGNY